MKAVTWHGKRDVRVEDVPDPRIEEPTDAIVRITSTALCGSDLHLYELLGPFLSDGDVLGHEGMGIVEEVGPDAAPHLSVGDRVVVPFNIACGHCVMCLAGLQTQCETTQVRSEGTGAALFGYTKLYGSVPGAQAEAFRVPQAQYGPIKVPAGPPDDRFLFLSDVLPTAWQAVEYAAVPIGGSLAILGLGPVGEMCCRVARQRGVGTILAVEPVPERRARAERLGVEAFDPAEDRLLDRLYDRTEGRGPDSVIDAVGMEASGDGLAWLTHQLVGLMPGAVAEPMMEHAGIDRLSALRFAIELVRRGGTISIIGVYGGAADPLPMLRMFDKQVTLRMGQANVRRWVPDLLPLVTDADVLGLEGFATNHVPLDAAPEMYERFQKKEDGVFKVVFQA